MNSTPSPTSLGSLLPQHKVTPRHLDRLATVYIRQSTVHQVQQHKESTRIQYGLAELAGRLGWPKERVLIIDEDLGCSGATAEGRRGFQRLLGEVALDHVGLILGVEMSRLARSCKDWYQLLELCALFGTLIGDCDGLYDPAAYNDRLLLGLKGTMSEAELHILQQRMLQGSRNKAQRGELVTRLPIGYVRDSGGSIQLDPDEQVRASVRQVFELFARLGTVSGVLKRMADCGLRLGVRTEGGPERGTLEWKRANQSTLRNMLAHPMYAGAYTYGRRGRRQRAGLARRQRCWLPRDQWRVLLTDRLPAYISWGQHQANLAQMEENRSHCRTPGSVRCGRALLAGLVVCGYCGYRLFTRYGGKASQPRYCCAGRAVAYGERGCQGLSALALDEEVVRLALLALEPSALEVSLKVAADLESQQGRDEANWRQRLERAAYEAQRARRQFEAVEPENRLVARTLESQWEQKLQVHRALCEEHERFLRDRPRLLGAEEQAQVRRLATDLPGLWQSSTTTDEDRKFILRQVIDKVVVKCEGSTEWCEAHIHWAGGQQTYTRLRRPVARIEQLSEAPAIQQLICQARQQGLRAPQIAAELNQRGLRGPDGNPFTASGVRTWVCRYARRPAKRPMNLKLQPNEWLLQDLCEHLDVSHQTVRGWILRRQIVARQLGGPGGRWVLRVSPQQAQELMAYRRRRYRKSRRESLPSSESTGASVSGGAL